MSSHTLVLLRHGKSDWSVGETDRERPLAKRGRRQAAEAGQWLAANIGHLDLAVVSPAKRATSTWEIASAELSTPPPTRRDERVYAASASGLLEVVRGLPDDTDSLVLVGHNPGLEDLVESLVGRWVPMPTSALAVLTIAEGWSEAATAAVELTGAGRPPRGQPPV